MKVLIVTGIFPPDIGGPATYVPLIAKALTEREHQVTVLTTSEPENLLWDDGAYPFPVVRINRRQNILLRMLRCVAKVLRWGRSVDVIYANGIFFETVIANKFLRKPLVMKIVGDEAWERSVRKGWTKDNFEDFQNRRQSWQAELLKRHRSWFVRQADKVITPSQYLAKWVAKWGVAEDRIKVIYNAVEPVDEVEPLPVPLATPIKAVTVGRLVPWKRVDRLLEVLKALPELGLVVVGDGPERPRLEQMARELGISSRVYFAGQRTKRETLSLMAACDIFLLNSTYEGLPHVVLEAMALGLPVVATAVGGVPEVVRDRETGMLSPIDSGALNLALRQLVEDSALRQRLGERGYRWIQQHFNQARMIKETETILLSAIREVEIGDR
jgi:glycosyltransferase involved in cell wall biosynthesis